MRKDKTRVLKINSNDYEKVITSEFHSWVLLAFKALNVDTDLYLAMTMDMGSSHPISDGFTSSMQLWHEHLADAAIEVININNEVTEIRRIGRYVENVWIKPEVMFSWKRPRKVRTATPPGTLYIVLEYTEPF